MIERFQGRTDRMERVTQAANGEPVVTTLMEALPIGRINYGARPEKAKDPKPSKVLPEGVTQLDLRRVGEGAITLGLDGDDKPNTVILDEEGKGILHVGEGDAIVIYAANLVADARADEPKGINHSTLTSKTALSSENGQKGRVISGL
jgi:hypothetical protein